MNTFIVIILIVIVLVLIGINNKLSDINKDTDKIRDMAEMSDQQRYEYSLKIDDREGYSTYLEGKYYREQAQKEKE